MVHVVEHVQAHYESSEVPFGKVYEWHPAYVVIECECGEKVALRATTTITTCGRCGAELGTFVHDIREREGHLPDKLSTPGSTTPKSVHNNTRAMRKLFLKARAGVTTILRRLATRSS